jgi:iron complex transport system substrate-binding protein
MLNNKKLKMYILLCLIIVVTIFLGRQWKDSNKSDTAFNDGDYLISFVDDAGYDIKMKEPAKTIISLYSAHTENLFTLGADKEIIGVTPYDIYPADVLTKEVFDYKSDPEKVIAKKPDVVIIRPYIERKAPDFVNALKDAGITVISLYPDNFEEFDDYILKLAMITGKEEIAKEKLNGFHKELDSIVQSVANIDNKVGVFFESSSRGYTTITEKAMPAYGILTAGGNNVAKGAVAVKKGSTIASYGIEKILEKANDIDIYVTQRGVMGGGDNYHSITIRPGFHAIKAIKNDNILEINGKIISSPTFRFIKGVKELRRFFYPEKFNTYNTEKSNEYITREELSEVLVKYTKSKIFIPTTSYYRDKDKSHYYGMLEDVPVNHNRFDYIETALRKSYFKVEKINDLEYFYPDKKVTREQFARILYLITELKSNDNIVIEDVNKVENERIVQAVVSNGLMELNSNKFNAEQFVSWEDVLSSLERIEK